MFRKPLDVNPPSRTGTLQAPAKTPFTQSGKVASLIQLHNSREGKANAEPTVRPRTGTWQRNARADTFRDGSNNPPAYRVSSWRASAQESRKNSLALQSQTS